MLRGWIEYLAGFDGPIAGTWPWQETDPIGWPYAVFGLDGAPLPVSQIHVSKRVLATAESGVMM